MMSIAICDDEDMTCAEIEEYLLEYAKERNSQAEIEVFYSGEELCSFMEEKEGQFDLIFLDIELRKMNGVETGKIIREKFLNESTQIIYISSKESYALELFQVRPFDFLIKPIRYSSIETVMDKYRKLYPGNSPFFEYHVGKKIYKTAQKEIVYFGCKGKKICIVTQKGTREFYGKMADVQKAMDGNQFWTIHKSYIVNIDYVSEFRQDEVLLYDETILPISQAYRKSVRQGIMERSREGRV